MDPRLESILDSLKLALFVVDEERRVVSWSDCPPGSPNRPLAWRRRREECLGRTLDELLPGPELSQLADGLHRALREGERTTLLREEHDGSRRNAFRICQVPLSSGSRISHVLCWAEDVTAPRRTEERLRTLDKALETMQIGVTISDLAGRILYTNPADAHMHGYEPEELVGRDAGILAGAVSRRPLSREQLKRIQSWRRESRNVTRDGREFPVQLLSDVVMGLDGEPVALVTTCEDISERKRFEEQIEALAYRDTLTGLPNRRLFDDRLRVSLLQTQRQAQRLAILFVDLDGFKLVNDSLGHGAGDTLLKEVAERLSRCVREGDTVARLGGDEFTLLLPGIEPSGVEKVAEKVLAALRPAFHLAGQELFISCSVGVAVYPDHGGDVDGLIRSADAAMYRAKEMGRDTYRIYEREMSREARERLYLESGLRQALRLEELEAHYLPIVSCSDGALVGLEALVRWHHPERGLLPPGDFLPIAEETGLVVPLGLSMLRMACGQLRRWQGEGLAVPGVAVNLSGRHLQHPSLLGQVKEALGSAELPPSCLTLEITETASMQRADQILGTLTELRELGVRISIDDFGSGFSSLGWLNRLPIHSLKIDRSLIAEVGSASSEAPIASAVIGLAHSLGLQVIAEGVETEAQRDFLRAQRCDAAQGHLFSPALTPERCAEYLRRMAE